MPDEANDKPEQLEEMKITDEESPVETPDDPNDTMVMSASSSPRTPPVKDPENLVKLKPRKQGTDFVGDPEKMLTVAEISEEESAGDIERISGLLSSRISKMSEESFNGVKRVLVSRKIATVLEYGSGASTLYFAKKVKQIITVEHNPVWVVLKKMPYNVIMVFTKNKDDYIPAGNMVKEADLVSIDGKWRKECFEYIRDNVKWTVMMIHDWGRDTGLYDLDYLSQFYWEKWGAMRLFFSDAQSENVEKSKAGLMGQRRV